MNSLMRSKFKLLDLILDECVKVKAGERFLVISDTYVRSKLIGEAVADAASTRSADVAMIIMPPRTRSGHEPPDAVAEAMKASDVVFTVAETYIIDHTNARKQATEAGVRFFETLASLSEDYFDRAITIDDLRTLREKSERLAKKLTRATKARITTPFGTNLEMSLEGRNGIPIHPLSGAAIGTVPDYSEAAIAPVEGTSNGVVVVDSSIQGWNYILRRPIHFNVKNGRVSEVSGDTVEASEFKKIVFLDENSANCAAELGIGTSHTIPTLQGIMWDYAQAGTVHIAVGRNNDIGGGTWSRVHNDVLMTQPTVEIDGEKVVENGTLKI